MRRSAILSLIDMDAAAVEGIAGAVHDLTISRVKRCLGCAMDCLRQQEVRIE